ncbi:tripartite tricarboxylate transporter substrate-binding protein [Rhodoplanes sp. TEM]|uniref:Tripartite tricarboxylate transporter substrate-binding protein n=1 Tax=Rhodoplanes tepidamans TaxID=200616 RepID=A0ABT5JE35_RHOTP|nr:MULTISPECIES: tripartite tricarboxylate transporter substrate-binding protein [Rhodoplanes]MDC7787918.1 tripartite tricarboxylate transporter substrate-binding protein [Rhodoplanes tepidamans]MDC7987810.1 tripartite tricarboxylate transporter substrate-binding protein [Rhodoplanes sp. TEM]MDQ0354841.1 tripartite-type tricarboxylate transporter receptor subunit TctC [Rhodoplanes tepidamans]
MPDRRLPAAGPGASAGVPSPASTTNVFPHPAASRRTMLGLAGSAAAWAVAGAAWPRPAGAEDYPNRTITMLVPFPAGGPTDSIARLVAERMRQELGQAIVIDNVGGGAGSIALGRLARSPADGYTIDVGNWGAHVANGALSTTLPYDVRTSFEPVALLATTSQLVLARPTLPADDLTGMVAWVKASGGKVSIGTAGVGSPSHVAALLFLQMIGAEAVLVPYRGATPFVKDLVSGQIDLLFTPPTGTLPLVRDGQLKCFAVAAPTRLRGAPEIPSADEAGLPGFHAGTWNAIFAPRGTPRPIVERLNAAAVAALADPAVRARLADLGQDVPPREQQTPEALGALVEADIERWWPIIRAAGAKAN